MKVPSLSEHVDQSQEAGIVEAKNKWIHGNLNSSSGGGNLRIPNDPGNLGSVCPPNSLGIVSLWGRAILVFLPVSKGVVLGVDDNTHFLYMAAGMAEAQNWVRSPAVWSWKSHSTKLFLKDTCEGVVNKNTNEEEGNEDFPMHPNVERHWTLSFVFILGVGNLSRDLPKERKVLSQGRCTAIQNHQLHTEMGLLNGYISSRSVQFLGLLLPSLRYLNLEGG